MTWRVSVRSRPLCLAADAPGTCSWVTLTRKDGEALRSTQSCIRGKEESREPLSTSTRCSGRQVCVRTLSSTRGNVASRSRTGMTMVMGSFIFQGQN